MPPLLELWTTSRPTLLYLQLFLVYGGTTVVALLKPLSDPILLPPEVCADNNSKTICNVWQNAPKMLEVSQLLLVVGVGTVLRLERDAWSLVKWLRLATNQYALHPSQAWAVHNRLDYSRCQGVLQGWS